MSNVLLARLFIKPERGTTKPTRSVRFIGSVLDQAIPCTPSMVPLARNLLKAHRPDARTELASGFHGWDSGIWEVEAVPIYNAANLYAVKPRSYDLVRSLLVHVAASLSGVRSPSVMSLRSTLWATATLGKDESLTITPVLQLLNNWGAYLGHDPSLNQLDPIELPADVADQVATLAPTRKRGRPRKIKPLTSWAPEPAAPVEPAPPPAPPKPVQIPIGYGLASDGSFVPLDQVLDPRAAYSARLGQHGMSITNRMACLVHYDAEITGNSLSYQPLPRLTVQQAKHDARKSVVERCIRYSKKRRDMRDDVQSNRILKLFADGPRYPDTNGQDIVAKADWCMRERMMHRDQPCHLTRAAQQDWIYQLQALGLGYQSYLPVEERAPNEHWTMPGTCQSLWEACDAMWADPRLIPRETVGEDWRDQEINRFWTMLEQARTQEGMEWFPSSWLDERDQHPEPVWTMPLDHPLLRRGTAPVDPAWLAQFGPGPWPASEPIPGSVPEPTPPELQAMVDILDGMDAAGETLPTSPTYFDRMYARLRPDDPDAQIPSHRWFPELEVARDVTPGEDPVDTRKEPLGDGDIDQLMRDVFGTVDTREDREAPLGAGDRSKHD